MHTAVQPLTLQRHTATDTGPSAVKPRGKMDPTRTPPLPFAWRDTTMTIQATFAVRWGFHCRVCSPTQNRVSVTRGVSTGHSCLIIGVQASLRWTRTSSCRMGGRHGTLQDAILHHTSRPFTPFKFFKIWFWWLFVVGLRAWVAPFFEGFKAKDRYDTYGVFQRLHD